MATWLVYTRRHVAEAILEVRVVHVALGIDEPFLRHVIILRRRFGAADIRDARCRQPEVRRRGRGVISESEP